MKKIITITGYLAIVAFLLVGCNISNYRVTKRQHLNGYHIDLRQSKNKQSKEYEEEFTEREETKRLGAEAGEVYQSEPEQLYVNTNNELHLPDEESEYLFSAEESTITDELASVALEERDADAKKHKMNLKRAAQPAEVLPSSKFSKKSSSMQPEDTTGPNPDELADKAFLYLFLSLIPYAGVVFAVLSLISAIRAWNRRDEFTEEDSEWKSIVALIVGIVGIVILAIFSVLSTAFLLLSIGF